MPQDTKIRVFYKNSLQNADKPEPPTMFHLKEFTYPSEALAWIIREGDRINSVMTFHGQVHLTTRIEPI